jgi:hypothetical protein
VGLLAFRAAAAGAPIDDLVLWAVPARGRTLVRQLRALAGLEASRASAGSAAPAAGGFLSAGFALSAETVAALERIDLAELALPDPRRRRVLALDRDGLSVDQRLLERLEADGVEVTVAAGTGYGAMVTPPQHSQAPLQVFGTVAGWLHDEDLQRSGVPAAGTPAAPAGGWRPASHLYVDLEIGGVRVREQPLTFTGDGGIELPGILTQSERDAPLCAVLLNAGALRRIGPARMWVELARRWAVLGVPTIRLDLAGIGDAEGDARQLRDDAAFYLESYAREALGVLDALSARGLPDRFVVAGLCSGAYWAMHAALEDERVAAAYMVNPRALFWDWRMPRVRNARDVRKLTRAQTWQKLIRGEITARRMGDIATGVAVALRTLPARTWGGRNSEQGIRTLELALDRLERNEVELMGVFTAEEPLLEELRRDGRLERMTRRPNVSIEQIPGPLVSHTLEPLPLQRAVHAALDRALIRHLDQLGGPGAPTPAPAPGGSAV